MDIGTILIRTSLLLALGVLGCTILHRLTKNKFYRDYQIYFVIACFGAITFAYLLLTYYFLISNFDIHYVWYNSSKNLVWYLKFAGVWAGQEGSLLLWVWIILLALSIEEIIQFLRQRKISKQLNLDHDGYNVSNKETNANRIFDWTRTIVILVVLVFLILLIIKDPFEPIHLHEIKDSDGAIGTIDPEDYPGGHGMNPMLRNIWMVIHPPLLFIGYAFITIPFAASLAYSITNDRKWTKISLQWSRLAWLFLTLGIGIGAIWAYIALGWGGYWSWDPVEVASLIPWITLSAFLHTQLMNKRKNEYGIITPLLGTVTFVLVIFATFITRSGLWTSVHAWSETEIGLVLIATMVCTLVLSALIILRSFIIRNRLKNIVEKNNDTGMEKQNNWDSLAMMGTIIIFATLTLITFVVLINTRGEIKPEYYETKLAPFVLILLAVMSICLCWRYFGKENSIYVIAWTMLTGVVCAVVLPIYLFPGKPEPFYYAMISTHHIVGFLIPFTILVIMAAIYKIIKQMKIKPLRRIW